MKPDTQAYRKAVYPVKNQQKAGVNMLRYKYLEPDVSLFTGSSWTPTLKRSGIEYHC